MELKDFYVGMKVECICSRHLGVNKGDIVTISHVGVFSAGDDTIIAGNNVRVKEQKSCGSFPVWYFDPVQKENHKFHVGQPVRCIDEPPLGKVCFDMVYTVKEITPGKKIIRLKEVNETQYASRFEPAYKLEVGCKVRALGNYTYLGEGIVKKYSPGCMVDVLFDGTTYQANISQKDLIVLEPAPKKTPKTFIAEQDEIVGGTLIYFDGDDVRESGTGRRVGRAIPDGIWDPEKTNHLGTFAAEYMPEAISYESIHKIMEDIKKQPIDKYGLMALETLNKQDVQSYLGIDWGEMKPSTMEIQRKHLIESSIGMIESTLKLRKVIEDLLGGKNMKDIADNTLQELAEKMNDEYVGSDSNGNRGRGTVFLKKAGECAVETRDVSINLADKDVLALLKKKGIAESLGDFQIQQYSNTLTVGIIKFKPLKKPEPENEEA